MGTSFEPLLDDVMQYLYIRNFIESCQWVIIGSQTKPYKPPKIEWVKEIVEACDKAGIPVFLKDNLKPLILSNSRYKSPGLPEAYSFMLRALDNGDRVLRQEFPK